jgi:hypothetical protein
MLLFGAPLFVLILLAALAILLPALLLLLPLLVLSLLSTLAILIPALLLFLLVLVGAPPILFPALICFSLGCALCFTLSLLFGALHGSLLLLTPLSLSGALILALLWSLLLLLPLLALLSATCFLCGLSLGSLILIWLCLSVRATFLAIFPVRFLSAAATSLRARNVGGAD